MEPAAPGGSAGEENPPPEGWKKPPETAGAGAGAADAAGGKPPKRKMKSPFQLEVLEKTYAVETYPSETLRAELSAKIGLTDRQLQMWFCHRRLKDRKCPPTAAAPATGKRQRRDDNEPELETSRSPSLLHPPLPLPPTLPPLQVAASEAVGLSAAHYEGRRVAVPRMKGDAAVAGKRYYESPPVVVAPPPPHPPQLSVAERRVIASVEAQLGEPLREDGPILGVEFDPLPPGAFGAPIEPDIPALPSHGHGKARQSLDRLDCAALSGQQKLPMRPYDGKMFERHEAKSIKQASTLLPNVERSFTPSSSSGKRKPTSGGALVVHSQVPSRALHEYQFLPEQPSIRSEAYERTPQSHFYDSPVVASSVRLPSLPAGGQYLHGNEQAAPSYTFQSQMSGAGLLSQQGRHQVFPSPSAQYDSAPHSNSYANTANDVQYGVPQVTGSENPYLASDQRTFHEDDTLRVERKRKSEEAKIAKEVEAHEKRIRRELEKQDILRRKREEQMRKEMERHDRERRKEEERLLRERQREEERFQKEQRRELERREKFLQKESMRAEKLRHKEELRREKEAARLKAANERATARRIAKESLELIEDERLELMELAASSKGLPSIISIDSDTLQQLDSFRDMLGTFPPKSVGLKQPFSVQPWTTEENIGNLLMVWKFLITFVDVLGLWPFTLDEFIQSLHDYESRLLGEIHVALLKSIIKDIEDVARTPAIALGVNQNSAANPGGGHPQIVEGAYAWGFDIRCWQRHLNPLTWPEILRQFALSAGFGPQLRKRNAERMYFRDDNEGNDGEDVISTLRNGAAAENAVALMQVRGYPLRRRSRHRLTPGTVKFAAFHVLSLEGSKGLTILEVADKIQKSGLRDLTTSKTPEASIAAALSRDTKLFERTAPSTYCVRTPYRKDPADADAVLLAAREKIEIFKSGLSDSEEAEKDVEDTEDAERDEDSECDADEDPEVDDVGTEAKLSKCISQSNDLNDAAPSNSINNGKGEEFGDRVRPASQNGLMNLEKGFSTPQSGNSKVTNIPGASQSLDRGSNCRQADIEDAEVDDSNFGEPWVQGLTEGEYFDLSIEERLSALVSLIGVAIEGNSIRVILEDRLEAATALKKQMWAEAQLDKRRLKDDYGGKLQHSPFIGYKCEAVNTAGEGSQTPAQIGDSRGNEGNLHPVENHFLDPDFQNNNNTTMYTDKGLLGQDLSVNADIIPLPQHGNVTEKSRSQLKSFIGHKAEELYVYRSLPLGQDRRRNRYWIFSTSTSRNDPGSGRIFFESRDGFWRLIDSEEAFDSLLAALDTRGIRESHLHSMLQRVEVMFKETIRRHKFSNSVDPARCLVKTETTKMSPDCSREFDRLSSTLCGITSDSLECLSSFKIEHGGNEVERTAALKRYRGFMRWMWKESYNPIILCAMKYGKKRCSELLQMCQFCYQSYFCEEKHCPSCHKTFKSFHYNDVNFPEHVVQCEDKRKADSDWKIQVSDSSFPIQIRLLKAQLSLIEASIPAEALQSFWTDGYRKSWGVKLQSSSSADDLLQILTLLEGAIKRECLSANFETTNELLVCASGSYAGTTAATFGSVPVLPWVPDTTAAVALRILDLDASISYMKVEAHKERDAGEFIKLPSRYAVVKNIQELEPTESPEQVDNQYEQKWLDPVVGRRGRGRGGRSRGGRGRGRGGRGPRGLRISTRTEFRVGNAINYEKSTRKYTKRGRTRGRGRRRGRRTVRSRPRSEARVTVEKPVQFSSFNDVDSSIKQDSVESSPRSSGGEEWRSEQTRMPYIEDDENSAGSHYEENGEASGEEYDDLPPVYREDYGRKPIPVYGGDYGHKPVGLTDYDSDDDEDVDGDEVEDDLDRGVHEDLDAEVDDEYEEEVGDDGMDLGNTMVNGDEEESASSYSSEYSD